MNRHMMPILRPGSKAALVVLALTIMTGTSLAQSVVGQVWRVGDPRPYPPTPGKIRWQGASKRYAVTDPNTGVTLPIELKSVAKIVTKKPAGLDAAIADVRAGRYTQAIAPLERIVGEYLMLQHDVPAAEALAVAYNATQRYEDTIRLIDRVKADKPPQLITAAMVQKYWEALLETKKYAQLKEELDQDIPNASREVAAAAQNMRGDIDFKKGNPKDALIDGYLRTVVLFKDVKSVQPEAIYKSMQCFEKLGRNGDKEKMRKKLLAKFPQSPYSRKVK